MSKQVHKPLESTTEVTFEGQWQQSDGRWTTSPSLSGWPTMTRAQTVLDIITADWDDTETRVVQVTTTRKVVYPTVKEESNG
jgi:hypothetical protein